MIDPTKIPEDVRDKMETEMLQHLGLGKHQELMEKEAMAFVRPRVKNPEDRTWLKRNKNQVPFTMQGKSRIYSGRHIAQFKLYGEAAWLLWGMAPPAGTVDENPAGEGATPSEANTASGNGTSQPGETAPRSTAPGPTPRPDALSVLRLAQQIGTKPSNA